MGEHGGIRDEQVSATDPRGAAEHDLPHCVLCYHRPGCYSTHTHAPRIYSTNLPDFSGFYTPYIVDLQSLFIRLTSAFYLTNTPYLFDLHSLFVRLTLLIFSINTPYLSD